MMKNCETLFENLFYYILKNQYEQRETSIKVQDTIYEFKIYNLAMKHKKHLNSIEQKRRFEITY